MSLKFNDPDDQPLPEEFLEQELPADFAALSEQLTADSQRLSSVYPAGRPPLELIAALGAESRRRSLPRQILGLASAAAGILLLVGLVGFALSPMLISQVPEPDAIPAEPPPALVRAPQPTNGSSELYPVSYRPAVVEVSGPALEGLLDLWQEQPQPDSTIAF